MSLLVLSPPPFAASVAKALLPGRALFSPEAGLPPVPTGFRGVRADLRALTAYQQVTGLPRHTPGEDNPLPLAFLYVLAQKLHLAQMARRAFPFSPIGLVHTDNETERLGKADPAVPFDLDSRAEGEGWARSGYRFSLVAELHQGGETIARVRSTYLRRMKRPSGVEPAERAPSTGENNQQPKRSEAKAVRLDLAGDLGRRYAKASGDYNPIHLTPLTSRLFGFKRPIAHGMFLAARAEAEAPGPLRRLDIEFRAPVMLPASVVLSVGEGAPVPYAFHAPDGKLHASGSFDLL